MIELPRISSAKASLNESPSGENGRKIDVEPASSMRAKALKFLLVTACVVSVSYLASASRAPTSVEVSNEDEPASSVLKSNSYEDHVDWNTFEPLKFHQSGFGALNIHHHSDGLSKIRRKLQNAAVTIPKSAVENATPSLGEPNIVNLHGHYMHDEHRSPYSSLSYARSKEELHQEQVEYEAKMQKVREEWGMWSFRDPSNNIRPMQDYSKIQYKDVKGFQWRKGVWQVDRQYTDAFISEGKKLVNRMTEGIYAELGHPSKKSDGSIMSQEELDEREAKFKIHISKDEDPEFDPKDMNTGVAYLSQRAFNALVRKLLHGMITNDEFYLVLGGHSAAAGHGNNLHQQKTMQFNHIMEPVFHKLGMRLMSRNMAMGGLGTLQFSIGQKELYGEKDFLMWDSMMTEKDARSLEMFNRQAMMNGERVPIIFTRLPYDIQIDTNNTAWLGDVIATESMLPQTTSESQGATLPWAVQYTNCAEDVDLCGGRGKDKYSAYCWEPRSDVDLGEEHSRNPMSNRQPKGQASWHPGWRSHQVESRKVALLFLKAFEKSFEEWEFGINNAGFPLADEHWHVGAIYKDIQDNFKANINGPRKGKSQCELGFKEHGLDKMCYTMMHGMSEFTPINLGNGNSIMRNAKTGANGFPKPLGEMIYKGPDILPLKWKIPEGDVDVHAIAIATNYEAPNFDHLFEEKLDEDDEDAEDAENERRDLKQISAKDASRSVSSTGIIPGEGWASYFAQSTGGIEEYCDGSAMSECNRRGAQCTTYGNNDRHSCLSGDGLSGWLVVDIPHVEEGLILAKSEWWHPNGDWVVPDDGDPKRSRKLGNAKPKPEDFYMDISVNGKITTWDLEKYMANSQPEMAYNNAIFRLVNDETLKGPVELGIRVRSESKPREAGTSICHIYWA